MAAPFDLIEEAKRIIRFNTVTWATNAECATHIGSILRKLGFGVFYQDSRVGDALFMNVAGLRGKGRAPVLLATHLDTVDPGDPALWTKTGKDPWKLTIRGGTLYGLGVADTKLDILCKLFALGSLRLTQLKRPVILLGTFGEESGLRGAARFCQGELPKPQLALVGEPSELSLVHRHKGLAVMEVLFKTRGLHRPNSAEWVYEAVFKGEAAHSSTPDLGNNALQTSVDFLKSLKKRYGKVVVLSWEGGTGQNVIPASAKLRFSIGGRPKVAFASNRRQQVKVQRVEPGFYPRLPWEDAVWCIDTLSELLAPHQELEDKAFQPPRLTWNVTWFREAKEGWSVTFDARPLPGQPMPKIIKILEAKLWKKFGHPGESWQFYLERDNPTLDLERQSPVLKLAASALRAARLPVKMAAKSGCSEAGLYNRVGIPSVVIGPGRSTGNIHRPNESVSLIQLKSAVRFYQAFLERACF